MPTNRVSTPCDAKDSSNKRPRSATRALLTSCTSVRPKSSGLGRVHTPGAADVATVNCSDLDGAVDVLGLPTNSGVEGGADVAFLGLRAAFGDGVLKSSS